MFGPKTVLVWTGVVLLSCMFLMGQGGECPWGHEAEIPDPNLEERIRSSLEYTDPSIPAPYYSGPLCTFTLPQLWYLSAGNSDIEDLSGLEYCQFLLTAYLHDNRITDLGPLAGMTELWTLDLQNNQISDLGPLAGLTDLRRIYLSGNQISDIGPLVENSGLYCYIPGVGCDEVHLESNPLSVTSCTVYIPELESRGVEVYHDCP